MRGQTTIAAPSRAAAESTADGPLRTTRTVAGAAPRAALAFSAATGARSASSGSSLTRITAAPTGRAAAVRTSRARPGHRAKVLALAASSSSAVSGETITSSTESAPRERSRAARRAPTSAADNDPRAWPAASARNESAAPDVTIVAAESKSTSASPDRVSATAESRTPASVPRDRSARITRASDEPLACVTGPANAVPSSRSAAHLSSSKSKSVGRAALDDARASPCGTNRAVGSSDGGGCCVVIRCSATTPIEAIAAATSQTGARKLTCALPSRRGAPRGGERARPPVRHPRSHDTPRRRHATHAQPRRATRRTPRGTRRACRP